ncbi:retrotransposon protein, putative, ty1-copia subclass [Tanacetum coccineum]
MFENEKLSGNNFNEWFARLKLVLRVEKKMHIIEHHLPPAPEPVAEPNVVDQWTAHTEIACLMLGSMTPELHRQFEMHYPYDMIQDLKSMFEKQAGVEKFDLIQSFYACKQEEGKPVTDYVLKMKGYVEKLERLGYVLPQDITVCLILNGLTKDFVRFKANKKSLNAKGNNKVKGKGKDKKVYIPKPKKPKPTAMERPAKDDACHHYKKVGHWKRNCPVYLAELLKKKKQVGSASSSGIFTIELFSFPNNNSWVYDTGCGTHICITKQGFRIERKRKQGALYLYVENEVHAQVEVIGSFDLVLPNGLVICLDNCYYAPTITRGVVSVSRLETMGYYFYFPPENKIVVARYAEFFEKRLISQEISGRVVDLEEIQEEEDTTPSEITSYIPQEVKGFEPPQPPQEEVIPIRRSERTRRATNRLCLNVEVEEHSLGDLGEPANYKTAMLDPESKRCVDAMNAEM